VANLLNLKDMAMLVIGAASITSLKVCRAYLMACCEGFAEGIEKTGGVTMKFFKVLFPLLLVASLSLPFVMKGPDGKPIMELDSLFTDNNSGSAQPSYGGAGDNPSSGRSSGKYYRWQDANGQWHFSDTAQASHQNGSKVEQVSMNNQINLMDGVAVPENTSKTNTATESPRRDVSFPTTIDPRDIPKLIQDAKNVQKLADERAAELERY